MSIKITHFLYICYRFLLIFVVFQLTVFSESIMINEGKIVAVHGFKGSGVQGCILAPGLHFVFAPNPER